MSKMNRRQFLGASAALAGAAATLGLPRMSYAQGVAYKGELEMWDWETGPKQEFMDAIRTAFEKSNPGITTKYTTFAWGDLATKILTASETKSNPPLSKVHNEWRPALQKAGRLAPYPDDIFDFSKLASTPFLKDPTTGKVYTSLFGYYCDQVFLSTEDLAKQGIKEDQIPRKWDDFIKFAQQLTTKDASGKIRPGISIQHYYSQQWLWQTLVYQQGAFLYNEDATQAIWNSEAGVKALQLIKDWYLTYKIDDVNGDRSFDRFQNQDAAGYISQGYTAGDLLDPKGLMYNKWTTAVTPTWTGKPLPSWGLLSPEEGYAVFANYPKEVQDASFALIKNMMASDENRIKWSVLIQGPTDRVDLLNSEEIKKNDIGKVIQTQGETIPYRINAGEQPLEAVNFWKPMFESVLLNGVSAKEALDTATAGMNKALKDTPRKLLIQERSYKAPAGT